MLGVEKQARPIMAARFSRLLRARLFSSSFTSPNALVGLKQGLPIASWFPARSDLRPAPFTRAAATIKGGALGADPP